MIIYIDNEFKCHTTPGEDLTTVETDFFDGKCNEYIEGYRYVPEGKSWTRSDGEIFHGIMVSPWKPWSDLYNAQIEYERALLIEVQKQNDDLILDIANILEEVYQSDLEMMGI